MNFSAVLKTLSTYAPLQLAEDWDNVGLLIQSSVITPTTPITKLMLCVDLTSHVVAEAKAQGANMVLAYHPAVFSSMKKLTPTSGTRQAVAIAAIEAGLAVYSPHTAFDSMAGGINDWIASGVGKGAIAAIQLPKRPLPSPDPAAVMPVVGAGRIVTLDEPITVTELAARMKKLMGLEYVRIATPSEAVDPTVRTVAICAGSGSSLLSGVKADAYVTGEFGHHNILEALELGTSVVLCEHSASEVGFLSVAQKALSGLLPGVSVVLSSSQPQNLLKTL